MGFQTPQYQLADLLRRAATGKIQLPDFQRGYKWDEERIRSLLVTVMMGHPLGAIMLLAAGNDQVRFKPKALQGTAVSQGVEPEQLLLDGQQRLTSLFQALTGEGVVDTTDVRGKQIRRRFYIKIDQALGDPANRDDAIVALPEDCKIRSDFGRVVDLDVSTPELERQHGYYPVRLVFSDPEGTRWLFKYSDEETGLRFFDEIRTPMLSYAIPAIELDNVTTKAAVATVFEKVNTGGLPLNVFELLTATFAGDPAYFAEHGTDFRLNDDWLVTKAIIEQHPVLTELQNTDFLQAVTLLATLNSAGATSARKGDILKLTLQEYLAWAPKVRDALDWVAHFFDTEHIHSHKDVPYQSQVVPLAVVRVVLGADADLHGVRARLRQWYWCGVLGEMYGSTTETRFARDVDQVPAWSRTALQQNQDPFTVPTTITEASFRESRLISLHRRNAAAYKGIYALLMATGCRDWKANQAFDRAVYLKMSVDIHHVFPQKWCRDNSIDPNLRESIVNKTPLAAKTNQEIGGAAPSQYLLKVARLAGVTAESLDTIVRDHLIDTDLLRADDFEGFFRNRRQVLLMLVESAMGKSAQRDVNPDEVMGGEESPAAFVDPLDSDLPDGVEDSDEPEEINDSGVTDAEEGD